MENKPWYDNKDLFEMIQGLKSQLTETTRLIKNYNGLREKLDRFEIDMTNLKQKEKNKKESKKDWQWVLGYVLAIGSLLVAIFK